MGLFLRRAPSGAINHVMYRGDRREAIFKDDEDRQGFLGTMDLQFLLMPAEYHNIGQLGIFRALAPFASLG